MCKLAVPELIPVIKALGGKVKNGTTAITSLKFTFDQDQEQRVFSLGQRTSGQYEVRAFTNIFCNQMWTNEKGDTVDILVPSLSELQTELQEMLTGVE